MQRTAWEVVRYFGCSVVALVADLAIFSIGMYLGTSYPIAAAVGFIVGLWVVYALSVRFAFRARAFKDQRLEFIVFASIGIAGLLLTEALLWVLVEHLVLPPLAAKMLTAGVVFFFNFGLRKWALFTQHGKVVPA
jgi:putative flippase GtrA